MTKQLSARADDRATNSEAVEDYVRAVLRTARGPQRISSTTEIADCLGVTPASVSSMFKRLARLGLVAYEPYRGVCLTPEGERLALRLTRRHRLLETFLADTLGMPVERVHAEADRLEHHISDELEALIATHLGARAVDPHGDPIPTAQLNLPNDDTIALVDVQVGRRGTVARVADVDAEVLRYLSETARIGPGTEFVLDEKQPFGGAVLLCVGQQRVVLARALAARVRVRPTESVQDRGVDRG